MDFMTVTSTMTTTVIGNNVTVTSGPNSATHTGIFIEHILSALDISTLDLSADGVIHHVLLTAWGTHRGFQGIIDGLIHFDTSTILSPAHSSAIP